MKRPSSTFSVLLAAGMFSASMFLAGTAVAGEGVRVAGDRSSAHTTTSPSIATAATARVAVSPLVATVGGGGANSQPAVATPTVVDFDGSQRAMPYELYSAIVANFPASEVPNAIAVVRCETGRTWRSDLVSRDGAQGAFQVVPAVWGTVPADYSGQAQQAASIVAAHSWRPWSCQP